MKIIGVVATMVLLAACSNNQVGLPGATLARGGTSARTHDARVTTCGASDPLIYLSNDIYASHLPAWRCGIKQFTIQGSNTGIGRVAGLAPDPVTGNTYQVNYLASTDNINIWGPSQSGNVAPLHMIGSGSYFTNDVTLNIASDSHGNLWVAQNSNCGYDVPSCPDGLLKFNEGRHGTNLTPNAVVTTTISSIIGFPYLATSPTDNSVYAIGTTVGRAEDIEKFPASSNGSTTPTWRLAGSNVPIWPNYNYDTAGGIAVGGGLVYVSDTVASTIWIWKTSDPSGNIAPDYSIAGGATGLGCPDGMAVAADGNLYVTDDCAAAVLVFGTSGAFGNEAPINTYSIPDSPNGLSLCYGTASNPNQCASSGSLARRTHK